MQGAGRGGADGGRKTALGGDVDASEGDAGEDEHRAEVEDPDRGRGLGQRERGLRPHSLAHRVVGDAHALHA
jgi:hypothetical protein